MGKNSTDSIRFNRRSALASLGAAAATAIVASVPRSSPRVGQPGPTASSAAVVGEQQRLPLWEQFVARDGKELLGLVAGEIWSRTADAEWAVKIAEAEVAVQLSPSRRSAFTLYDVRADLEITRADQAAVVGFYLALTLNRDDALASDVEAWCRETMRAAGLVEIPPPERARLEARISALYEQIRPAPTI